MGLPRLPGGVEAFGGSGYVGYCSLSHFERSGHAASWRLVGELGDVAHLSEANGATALGSAW